MPQVVHQPRDKKRSALERVATQIISNVAASLPQPGHRNAHRRPVGFKTDFPGAERGESAMHNGPAMPLAGRRARCLLAARAPPPPTSDEATRSEGMQMHPLPNFFVSCAVVATTATRDRREARPRRPAMTAEEEVKRVHEASNHYSCLGVQPEAPLTALREAYKKLSLALHPDKCAAAGAEAAFKKVAEAFRVLNDPAQRLEYDSVLSGPGYEQQRFDGSMSYRASTHHTAPWAAHQRPSKPPVYETPEQVLGA